MNPTVTICIPTYRSEGFIHRTLGCARAQTHTKTRIVVSVDACDDGTVEVCMKQAQVDARIEVLVQPERLGWSQNANAALARVDTEFSCLYFHDDIIEPTYLEKLLGALTERTDAASAHCDLVEFGLAEGIKPAHAYEGPPPRRLIEFMLTRGGPTLRSLTRTAMFAAPLRFPRLDGDGHWTAYVFHLRLLAGGPALAVHESLYRRWQRDGSLTRSPGWQPEELGRMLRGQSQAAQLCLGILDGVSATPDEHRTARYCLQLLQLLFTRRQQLRMRSFEAIGPKDLAGRLGAEEACIVPGVLDQEAQEWLRHAESQLATLDRQLEQARGKQVAERNPDHP